jgi:predicted  nucleic acid-binding Zn-ribbon protein
MADPRAKFHAAALRWRKNDLDLLRRNLSTLQSTADKLDVQRAKINSALQTEAQTASTDVTARFDLYAASQRAQLAGLAVAQQKLDAEIYDARDAVSKAFETYKPIERVAELHAEAQRSAAATKLQAELDDRAAAVIGQEDRVHT